MQNIGKFQVVAKLGEGGMGVVYKAYDPLMERHVAIKTITREMSGDARSRDRFLREGRAIARLEQHKNVVTVHELFEEAGQTYLVMELLVGSSLEEALKAGKRLSLEEKLRIIIEVCDGLAYAHANDIIHRDIKPGNIFLGRNRSVKILDFGLAHIAAGATQTLRNVGTPSYMSPEQWKGEEADHRTDIFSLGVVSYELLTGRRPFWSDNLAALGLQVLNEAPAPLHELNAVIPLGLSNAIARAMAKDRDQRYADAREMARDLEQVRHDIQEAAQGLLMLACKSVDDFEGLVDSRRELFRAGLLESVLSVTGSPPVDARLLERIRGRAAHIITNGHQSVDYLELFDEMGQIQSQLARAKEILPRLERANSVLKCAEIEESEGNLEGALRMANAILSELPSWTEAAGVVERVREKLQLETAEEAPQNVRDEPKEEQSSPDPTACLTGPEEGRREEIAGWLGLAQSLLQAQREKKGPLEVAARTDASVDDFDERQQRIAALLAEASAQMEAQRRLFRALDPDEEPEEAFVFRKKTEPQKTDQEREPTVRLRQNRAAGAVSWVAFTRSVRAWLERARSLWTRLFVL